MVLAQLTAPKLSKEFTDNLLIKLIDAINSRDIKANIILFGSAARNEMTAFSDIDLIFVVATIDDIKPTRKALSKLSIQIDWPIDLLIIDKNNFEIKSAIGGVYFDAVHEGRNLISKLEELP